MKAWNTKRWEHAANESWHPIALGCREHLIQIGDAAQAITALSFKTLKLLPSLADGRCVYLLSVDMQACNRTY